MRIHDAIGVFKKYGVDVGDLPLEQIRKIRNALIQRYHPDVGGAVGIAQEINAAFDLLRNITPDLSPTPSPRQPPAPQPQPEAEPEPQPSVERVVRTDHDMYRNGGPKPQSANVCDWGDDRPTDQRPRHSAPDNRWAWAGHFGDKTPDSTISKSDFTDANFIKRSMWELSGNSNDEWTISGYDGKLLLHNIIVYGSPKIFNYMAIAMKDFQMKGIQPTLCRAVFARPGVSHNLYLIYADGKYYDENPIKLKLESFGSSPTNCAGLMQKLPSLLDGLQNQSDWQAQGDPIRAEAQVFG